MFNLKQINTLVACFSVGALLGTTLLGQQTQPSQQTQPTYQYYQQPGTQAPVYQTQQVPSFQQQYPNQVPGQAINGQIINGQVIIGRTVDGQPIYGQPAYGQQVPGGVVIDNGQPVNPGQVQPTAPQQQPQNQPYAMSKADQEKMKALTDKVAAQAEKVEFLVNENVRLTEFAEQGKGLMQKVQGLTKELDAANAALNEMRNKPADVNEDMSSQQQEELNRLNGQMQVVVQENNQLKAQMRNLVQQNEAAQTELTTAQTELANLKAADGNMSDMQATLDAASTKVNELGQQYQSLVAENARLTEMYQTAVSENENYNQQISTLSSKNAEYETTVNSLKSSVANAANKPVVRTKASANTNFAASQKSEVADLMSENEKLIKSRERVIADNEELTRKLSELEGTVGELTTSNEVANASTPLALNVPGLGEATGSAGKFSITNWIIPFLLLGLGIALYVFLSEEGFGGSGVRTVANDGREFKKETRDFKQDKRDFKKGDGNRGGNHDKNR
jgi:predicted nuclease with TOPRIM domain